MFNKEVFSHRLKELRSSKKLTLEQLGKELGVIKQTIGHWESGIRLPNLEMTVSIADYFNVSLDYLVGRTNTPEIRKDDE
jgi:transcriptional regulator with XRE-family HTH domain